MEIDNSLVIPLDPRKQAKFQQQQQTIQKTTLTNDSQSLFQHMNNLPNGLQNQRYYERYIWAQYCFVICLLINISFSIMYFEFDIRKNFLKDWTLKTGYILHFACLFIEIIKFKTFNDFKNHQKIDVKVKIIFWLFVRIVLLLLRPNPYLEDEIITFIDHSKLQIHKLNHLLTICSLCQIILTIPCLLACSNRYGPRSNRVNCMYGNKISYLNALKSYHKINSKMIMGLLFIFWIFIFSQSIRIAQYFYNPQLQSFQNSIWMTVVGNMMSIGYGDIFPVTILGKFIDVIAMYLGVLTSSFILINIMKYSKLKPKQKRSLQILNIYAKKNHLQVVAAIYLRHALWRVWNNKKRRRAEFTYQNQEQSQNQFYLKKQFRKKKNQLHQFNIKNRVSNVLRNNFQQIQYYISRLNENNESLIDYLQSKESQTIKKIRAKSSKNKKINITDQISEIQLMQELQVINFLQ